MNANTIIYTKSDEAPALATRSLLPIVRAFVAPSGIKVELFDISLAARILAKFPEALAADQAVPDALATLGELVLTPESNVVKLPNISASTPQLIACIEELQACGFKLVNYPKQPATEQEKEIKERYDKVKGSAVNPVLRQGNSDRRAPKAVKEFARQNPHRMGAWSNESKTHVATMASGDFQANEKSLTLDRDATLTIEHYDADGNSTILGGPHTFGSGDVVDASLMQIGQLVDFFESQIDDAANSECLLSLHLKATMMKVSDPIIFGHFLKTYFAKVFAKYQDKLDAAGVNPSSGLASIYKTLLAGDAAQLIEAFDSQIAAGPPLAMVDSDNGVTNLHVPSDVIIDASMAAMIRSSGQMWNAAGELQDTKTVIPDSSYAELYSETIAFCTENGAFDPTTMGTVPNVGLMAEKAEEYGSHDKTFEIVTAGEVKVVDESGDVLFSHQVAPGDIWRMCHVTSAAIADWITLGVSRAKKTNTPAVFWLDQTRPHDQQLIAKVNEGLTRLDTKQTDIQILSVAEATRFTLTRASQGKDTISVTGNVLRDYLTDLFPILELGTSAKMLSIVPLMSGGALFETGAGGSAPKHVKQFVAENHLRWDSLGEFLALAESLGHIGDAANNKAAEILSDTLGAATERLLLENKSPKRTVPELDNRGSHFFLALFWAQELANQSDDAALAQRFKPFAEELAANSDTIVTELEQVQGKPVDLGGYFYPDDALATSAMRPSKTFNTIVEQFAN